MRKIQFIVNVFIVFTLTCGSSFASNHADTFGASPVGIALGSAMTARVNDWSSVYYNVSGLGKTVDSRDVVSDGSKAFRNQVALSYILNKPDFNIDISRSNSITGKALSTNGDRNLETGSIIIGGVIDTDLIFKSPSFISSTRLGVLVAINDDRSLVKINDIRMETHNFFRYGRETQSLMLLIGGGFGFFDDTIGFGFGTAQSMGGKGRIVTADLDLTTEEQSPYMESTMDFAIAEMPLILGGYIKPGRIFPLLDGLDLGISYRQESYLYVDDFKILSTVPIGDIVLQLNAAMFDFYQPPITRVGFAYQLDNLIVSGDLELREWSEFKVSDLAKNSYKVDGVIIPIPKLDDVIIPRMGIEYRMNGVMNLLLGYYFEKSCVPDSAVNGIFNLLDNDKHVWSAGIQYRLPKSLPIINGFKGPADITATYQYQKLVDRDVRKTLPTKENPDYSYGGTCQTFMAGFVYHL